MPTLRLMTRPMKARVVDASEKSSEVFVLVLVLAFRCIPRGSQREFDCASRNMVPHFKH
jgi:hypothetical protein